MTMRFLTAASVFALLTACSGQPGPASLSPTEQGYNAYRAGNYAAAEAAYNSALAADRSNQTAMLGLAEVYESTGRRGEAAALYRDVRAARTGTIRVWNDGRAQQDGVYEVALRRLGLLDEDEAPVAAAPTVYTPAPTTLPAPSYSSEIPIAVTPSVPAPSYESYQPVQAVPAPTRYTAPQMSYSPAPTVYSSALISYTPAPIQVRPAPISYTSAPIQSRPAPVQVQPAQPTYRPAPIQAQPAPMTYQAAPIQVQPRPRPYRPAPTTYQPAPVQYQPAPISYTPAPIQYQPAPQQYQPVQPTYQPAPVTYSPTPITRQVAPVAVPRPIVTRRPATAVPAVAPSATTSIRQPGYTVIDGNFVYISAEDIASGRLPAPSLPGGAAAEGYGVPVPITSSPVPIAPRPSRAPVGGEVINGIAIPNLN